MTPAEAQALLEQVRKLLRSVVEKEYLQNSNYEDFEKGIKNLDQLSAHLAGQEKAVRVEVLKEVKRFMSESSISKDELYLFIDQKIEEVKKNAF